MDQGILVKSVIRGYYCSGKGNIEDGQQRDGSGELPGEVEERQLEQRLETSLLERLRVQKSEWTAAGEWRLL